ncbi:hypothetical protein K7472_23660 [Streptomyces sp. PTM05]|uniref:Uncharacterized protein n=1 Tax=Streptantibioticus parmotrematis TaxID=2873249 RepID=A0ABS7QX86_9ACTN|nr:hypothetical protein [Streptantibioticus parmotrematis]MBY8887815.1 hypothetical protein [Streptantibioticus parmotrematis]
MGEYREAGEDAVEFGDFGYFGDFMGMDDLANRVDFANEENSEENTAKADRGVDVGEDADEARRRLPPPPC